MDEKEEKDKSREDSEEKDSGTPTGKRKARFSDVEPRSSNKRQRVPVSRFQSPLEDLETKFKVEKEEKKKDDNITLYKKNSFLAVRGAEGSFYLCRAAQNIYSKSKRLRIQWLSIHSPPNVYKFDYVDTTEMETVLTEIKMDKVSRDSYRLPLDEQRRVEKILDRAIRVEQGVATADEVEEEAMEDRGEDDTEDEEEEDDEPTPQKRTKSGKSPSSKGKKNKDSNPTPKRGKELTKGKDKGKSPRQKEKSERKKGPDRNLKPNPKIKILEKDPFFETKEKLNRQVSANMNTLLAFRHVTLDDMESLKDLLSQTEGVYSFGISRSAFVETSVLDVAVKLERLEMIKTLTSEIFDNNLRIKRKAPPRSIISAIFTGSYNPVFLGIKNIRDLNVSRGGKEGNNAFLQEHDEQSCANSYLGKWMMEGRSVEAIETFIQSFAQAQKEMREDVLPQIIDHISKAVSHGHRHLAGKYITEAEKLGGFGFNYLHKEVLTFEKDDLRDIILASSVRKKPFSNDAITPLHCAAINPNVKYLTRLLSIEPDINIQTRSRARPIHFAAACEGTAPLEFLLKRNASPYEADSSGAIPLHYASRSGRSKNIDVLIKAAKANAENEDVHPKWGLGCVNRPNRFASCPIHMAVEEGHLDTVRSLIKYGADVNKPLSASKNKVTPLMLAAQRGDLNCVRLLIQSGAPVEMLDKIKRSALTHAVMNGCTTVVSYLLFLGADPNRVDSSNNSIVHYAAAYGWYHCLKLLIKDSAAKPDLFNDWQSTPISIAFLKGHHGLVEFLFSQRNVDINFKTDTGRTLVSIAAGVPLVEGLDIQIKYLVDTCKADPTITDVNGYNALHHLAGNNIKLGGNHWNPTVDPKAMALSVKIGEILIAAGCDPTLPTNDGKTPTMLAIEQVNIDMVKLLVENGGSVSPEKNADEKTVLHLMAEQCCKTNLTAIIKILATPRPKAAPSKPQLSQPKENGTTEANGIEKSVKENAQEEMQVDLPAKTMENTDSVKAASETNSVNINGEDDKSKAMDVDKPDETSTKTEKIEKPGDMISQEEILKKMVTARDFLGYTPLLRACQVYKQLKKNPRDKEDYAKYGLDFIQVLLELAGADVNAVVGPKNITDDPKPHYTDEGLWSPLHFMVNAPCETDEGLAVLLPFSPNCNLKNKEDKTPLALAVESSKEIRVKMLLENGADPNVMIKEPSTMVTPLVLAAERGSFTIMNLLLNYKADPMSARTDNKRTPIHILVTNRAYEDETIAMVQTLLQAGAKINATDSVGNTPFHLAVASNKGHSDTSTSLEEFLIDRGANCFAKNNRQEMPLHVALQKYRVDPIELCSLLTSVMRDQRVDEANDKGFTPLLAAAASGATICCMHLLQRSANLEAKEFRGNTPLNLAINGSHDSCAIMLMQRSANLNHRIVMSLPSKVEKDTNTEDNKKPKRPVLVWRPKRQWITEQLREIPGKSTTLFERAIENNLTGVAHMLLDAQGVPMSIIEAALNLSKFYLALRLLRRIPDANRLHEKNKDGQNLFHILAAKTSSQQVDLQVKVAGALLEKGVRLSEKDRYGMTPLMYASLRHQSIGLAKFLIVNDLHFDPKKKDNLGRDCISAFVWNFEWVSDKYKLDTVRQWLELLIDEGKMSLNTLYDHPLPDPLLLGAKISCQQPDYFETKSEEKTTPLIMAIRNYELGLAKFMLQKGASPNFPDSQGRTPMMHAVEMNDIKMVKLLINYSYNPDEDDVSDAQVLKPQLSKECSRQVFTIDFKIAKEKNPDDIIDEEADKDEESEAISLSKHTEENEDSVDLEDETEADDDEDEDIIEEDEREDNEDSDHDTDVVDDEDDAVPDFIEEPAEVKKDKGTRLQLSRHISSLQKEREFKTIEKTSPVDLSLTDKKQRTALHYAVSSFEFASFDNAEIAYVLGKAGAPLQAKTSEGLTALDLARKNNSEKIFKVLSNLQTLESQSVPVEPFERCSVPFTVKEPITDKTKPDYIADAKEMTEKLDSRDVEVEPDTKAKVDANCEIKKSGEVAVHQTTNIPYSVTLSKVDVTHGIWGMYNFYKLQIIKHTAKNMFVLFTRWGRIGDRGQFQHTPFQTLEEAAKEFCKIYKSKTGNVWNQTEPYVNRPKKYRLMPVPEKQTKQRKIDFHFENDLVSKLPEAVLDVISEMSSVNMFEASIKKIGLNEDFMPFGRMKRENLLEARKILTEISELIDKNSKLSKHLSPEETAEFQSNNEEIVKLTNEYYHLVPIHGFEYESISPISQKTTLREHTKLLANIMDVQIANTILLAANLRKSEIKPVDYIYNSLGCSIQPLKEDDIETQLILTYIHASVPTASINRIFKISKEGESERMASLNMPNHQLLWHGSSMSNFLSILSRGLLVAPPDVPWTGHLFGEGIYFADTFLKSTHYCHNQNPKSSCKVMLLCEVALGNSKNDIAHGEEDHLDSDINSLKILGKMSPISDFDVQLPFGASMALGQITPMTYVPPARINHNEYIIHNADQVALRYLVMF